MMSANHNDHYFVNILPIFCFSLTNRNSPRVPITHQIGQNLFFSSKLPKNNGKGQSMASIMDCFTGVMYGVVR